MIVLLVLLLLTWKEEVQGQPLKIILSSILGLPEGSFEGLSPFAEMDNSA